MIHAIRGMRDILPAEVGRWQRLEAAVHDVCRCYGYSEIRTPVMERTDLFVRTVGEASDIVAKEMYTFEDRSGDSITLRPEGTAPVARAYVEHNLEQAMGLVKLYYIGAMFRYERPQKGRYRQFYQFGIEAIGLDDPRMDADVIDTGWTLVERLAIAGAELVLNSVGCAVCRPSYTKALMDAIGGDLDRLCADCHRRAALNPLRIFDCKVASCQPIIERLPATLDFLCEECTRQFAIVRQTLELYRIGYRISKRLVRGLDYYTRTTFEIVAGGLGAQNAILGGGRYDGLVKDLGGPARGGVGFAAGMERFVLAMPETPDAAPPLDLFVVALDAGAAEAALTAVREARRAGLTAEVDYQGKSVKAQLRLANRLGARFAALVGGEELTRGAVAVRDLTASTQAEVARGALVDHVKQNRGTRGG